MPEALPCAPAVRSRLTLAMAHGGLGLAALKILSVLVLVAGAGALVAVSRGRSRAVPGAGGGHDRGDARDRATACRGGTGGRRHAGRHTGRQPPPCRARARAARGRRASVRAFRGRAARARMALTDGSGARARVRRTIIGAVRGRPAIRGTRGDPDPGGRCHRSRHRSSRSCRAISRGVSAQHSPSARSRRPGGNQICSRTRSRHTRNRMLRRHLRSRTNRDRLRFRIAALGDLVRRVDGLRLRPRRHHGSRDRSVRRRARHRYVLGSGRLRRCAGTVQARRLGGVPHEALGQRRLRDVDDLRRDRRVRGRSIRRRRDRQRRQRDRRGCLSRPIRRQRRRRGAPR